ncbi:uncharacterized protein [Phaenicophaeus curvirostris]|uniref:uncharacterized protein n=1 Tax=Phaenicophaeus curvirostris TaxID=33595 RepID=UPI0037F0B59E
MHTRFALEVNRIIGITDSQNTSSQDIISSGSEEKVIHQINPIYPQKELEEMRKLDKNPPHLRPLIKTEYSYLNDEDSDPHITTKETPYSATELAKLKKEYSCLSKESEREYVWRVSLTGGDQIQLREKEAEGYWGHRVFLTTGDHQAPWSLTQRAAYWAGGLNPLDRGDPLAITGTADQLLESVHETACLQMIHEIKLIPGCESPMMLPVNSEIMTPLIRGLPESFKSTGISLQRTIASMGSLERLGSFMHRGDNSKNAGSTITDSYANSSDFSTPAGLGNRPYPRSKIWTWGEKYCLVKPLEERSRDIQHVRVKNAPPNPSKTADVAEEQSQSKSISVQLKWWRLGLKKGIPKDLMDGLPLEKLSKLVTQWHAPKPHWFSSVKESAPIMVSDPPLINDAGKTSKQISSPEQGN